MGRVRAAVQLGKGLLRPGPAGGHGLRVRRVRGGGGEPDVVHGEVALLLGKGLQVMLRGGQLAALRAVEVVQVLVEIVVPGDGLRFRPVQPHAGQHGQIGLLPAVLGRPGRPLPVHGSPVLVGEGAAVILRPGLHCGVQGGVLQRLVLGVILQALAGDSVPPLDPLPAVVVVGDVVAGVGQPVEVSLGGHVPPVHGQQHSVRTDAGRLAEKSPLCVSAPAGGERDGGPQGQAKSDASFHHGSPLSFLADSVETPRTGQAGDVPPPPSYAGHGKNMMKLTGSRPRPPPRPASGPPPGPGRPPPRRSPASPRWSTPRKSG